MHAGFMRPLAFLADSSAHLQESGRPNRRPRSHRTSNASLHALRISVFEISNAHSILEGSIVMHLK